MIITVDVAEEPFLFRLLAGVLSLAATGAGLIAFLCLIFGPSLQPNRKEGRFSSFFLTENGIQFDVA